MPTNILPGLRSLNEELTGLKKIMKIPSTKIKFQTNPNDRNSKFQTTNPPVFVPNGIITVRAGIAKQY